MNAWAVAAVGVAAVLLPLMVSFFFRFGYIWLRALLANAYVPAFEIVGMSLRGANPRVIVDARIMALEAGLKEGTTTQELETQYLARGNVPNVVRAMVAAKRAGIPLTFPEVCAMDLGGQDVLGCVHAGIDAAAGGLSGRDRWAMVAMVGEPPEEGATLEVVRIDNNVVYLERV